MEPELGIVAAWMFLLLGVALGFLFSVLAILFAMNRD